MPESTFQPFNWDLDFSDKESVSAVYGGGGGPWRRELVTILDSYYTPDHFLARGKANREPEPGMVWSLYFHDPERRAQHEKAKPENRHWVTDVRFGMGRYAKVNIYDKEGVLVDPDSENPHGDYFEHIPGSLWDRGTYMRLHRSLKEVVPPPDLQEKWEALIKSGKAHDFKGLKCYLCQLDVEMDAEAKARGLENLKAKLRADGTPEEDVNKAKYYPPTYVTMDEIVGWEDLEALAAYDPNAPTITPAAVEFIKEQVGAGNNTVHEIGKAALNRPDNTTLHPAVHAALQDVAALKPHGIYWKGQKLSLEA